MLPYKYLVTFALVIAGLREAQCKGVVGSCFRVSSEQDLESCGRLIRSGVTEDACCSGRHRRTWGNFSLGGRDNSIFGQVRTCTTCATLCLGVQCGEDKKCVVRNGMPKCVCFPQCHLKHKAAVCGSDGRTYTSECHLLKRACRKKRRLQVAHYGSCQTCSGVRCSDDKRCVLDEQLSPKCVQCPTSCPAPTRPRPLCAADGTTYASSCHLKRASCRANAVIAKSYKGVCKVKCWHGQKCLTDELNGAPQCTWCGVLSPCRPALQPLCATDRRTYPSWCAMRHYACRTGKAITQTHATHCANVPTEPDCFNSTSSRIFLQTQLEKQQELARQKFLQKEIMRAADSTGYEILDNWVTRGSLHNPVSAKPEFSRTKETSNKKRHKKDCKDDPKKKSSKGKKKVMRRQDNQDAQLWFPDAALT